MELSMIELKGLKVWNEIRNVRHSEDMTERRLYIINQALGMWRKGEIDSEVLAVIVNATMRHIC